MPTNLPPEFAGAEERYRSAQTIQEKVAALEEMLSIIPKHKGTDHLRADYRRRLSKLKEAESTRKKSGAPRSPYHIDREGGGQVVVAGPANVGKSALVTALTNASPEVSPAPFSTWEPTPGMMEYKRIPVQLIDTPPLEGEYIEPEMLNLMRRADLILLVLDVQTYPIQQLENSLALLKQARIVPRHQQARYADQPRLVPVPVLVLANKCDDDECQEVYDLFCELLDEEWPLVPVSAQTGRNLEELQQKVVETLNLIRVYTKAPGEEPNLERPFVLEKGGTVADLALAIHRDFYESLKSARLWGSSAFPGQMVTRDYVLQDGDVVEFRI